jgi:hypothetical protein
MKKLYFVLLATTLFSSCKKDFDEDIIGTWTITDITVPGVGSSVPAGLPFKDGTISFHQDGSAFYTNGSGIAYQGKWSLERKHLGERQYWSLLVSVVHFPTQQILMDAFDDIIMTRDDRFKGEVSFDNKKYITHFRR